MENLANGTARLTSMIELTSAFYEAILHNSYINDPEMWMNYAKFKSKLYRNVTDTLAMGENTQVAVQSNCSHTSLQGSHASSKNTLSYQKNSKAEASLSAPSVNTLLYSDAVPDSLGNEDKNLKIFHPPDKNAHSNNITEFISTAKSLLSKFDAATTEVLQGHSTITEFNGARLVVPSKSAFYRVIAFCYIESLLLGKVPKSRTILRNLFHLVYQGKLALKGPNSVSPSETLRNTFCGYTKELIRLTLVGEAQAVTAFYTMINHDPAFDQSMVSLVKEIIITSLGSSSFVDENLPNSTEVEVKRTIDGIKNSTEITETLMSLVAVIFQVHLSLYSVEGKEVKERVFVPSSDGTDQSFTLSIISQNYRGYLNYFALYVKDKPTLSTLDLVSNPSKPQIVEPTKPEEREVITSQDEYFALGKPENMIHRNNSNQSTPTTPAKKVNMDDSPNSGASPSRFRKAHQPVSAFADATRSSENSATLKPQPIVKEANMISPKSMQPAPTRSFEYKPGEFKKLAAGDGSQYRVKPEANSNSASTIEETSRPRSTSTNALPNQQPQETQYLRPAERDSLSPGHKRSASDVRLIHGRKSLEIQEFFKHQQVTPYLCFFSQKIIISGAHQ